MKNSCWKYIIYFLRNAPKVLFYKLFRRKPRYDRIGKQKNITLEYSKKVVSDLMKSQRPFAMIRLGGTEISALNNFQKIQFKFAHTFKKKVRYAMKNNGGFFPVDDENLKHYGRLLQKDLQNADVLGISGLHMEDYFRDVYAPKAEVVQNWALDPLLGEWSHLLEGKKVLIISPLEEEIQTQYVKREDIFPPEANILPKFELKTLRAVQTIADASDARFSNWFEALDYMKMRILQIDFDIALVGSGVYGTALCVYIKQLGKQAIQTGGATQLLFGIIGKRWENRPYVQKYINSHWIRPFHRPQGYENVEKGCYW
ncbi:MAG: hypothetical protein ACOX3K_01510 [Bacilli bacterium]